jgi:hypothetical protein
LTRPSFKPAAPFQKHQTFRFPNLNPAPYKQEQKVPSQSSNSNGSYSVTSSGTNSQVCIHNTVLRYTLASPTITYPNLKIQSNSHRSLPQISTYANPNKQQGNSYDSRDYGSSASNQNSYHYSNSNGSYYYSNPNGKFGRKTTKKKKKKKKTPLPLDAGVALFRPPFLPL